MRNILFVSPTASYSGVDVCLQNLVLGIDCKQFTPIVILPQNSIIEETLKNKDIKIYTLPLVWWFPPEFTDDKLQNVCYNARFRVDAITHIIKTDHVDLVLSNTSVFLDAAIAAYKMKVPHIHYLHALFVDNIYTKMSKEFKTKIYTLITKMSSTVVTCSDSLCKQMQNFSSNNNIVSIQNGVDTEKFHFTTRDTKRKNTRCICVGHLNHNKNQGLIIKALGIIVNQYNIHNIHLTLTGVEDVNYKAEICDLIEANRLAEYVTLTGFLDNIQNELMNHDIYINSSITETFPVSVLEAMSAGIPVVATPTHGALEIIENGISGIIADSSDEMAKAIIKLIQDINLYKQLSENGRDRCVRFFSIQSFIEQFQTVIDNSIIAGHQKIYDNVVDVFISDVFRMDTSNEYKKHILLIYNKQSIATYSIIGQIPLEYISGKFDYDYISKLPHEVTLEDIAYSDIIFNIRNYDDTTYDILSKSKSMGIPFVYFIDDNYFVKKSIANGNMEYKTESNEMYERFFRDSTMVTVCSPGLYREAQKYSRQIYLLPVYQYFEVGQPEEIRIGFMGTLSRDDDFKFLIEPIKRLIGEYGEQICFEFIGYCPDELKGYANTRVFPFMYDYIGFRRFCLSRKWSIGLAPLALNVFNISKTNNKFREYSSMNIAGIYSNIETYSLCVIHKETGFLVDNTPQAWYEAVKTLINSDDLRAVISQQAYQWVHEHYSIDDYCSNLLRLFEEYPKYSNNKFFNEKRKAFQQNAYQYNESGKFDNINRNASWNVEHRSIMLKREYKLYHNLMMLKNKPDITKMIPDIGFINASRKLFSSGSQIVRAYFSDLVPVDGYFEYPVILDNNKDIFTIYTLTSGSFTIFVEFVQSGRIVLQNHMTVHEEGRISIDVTGLSGPASFRIKVLNPSDLMRILEYYYIKRLYRIQKHLAYI